MNETKLKTLDDNKARDMIYKELKSMQKIVLMNNISFEMFEEYYNLLKRAISLGLLEKPLPFVLTLSDAAVMNITNDLKEEKIQEYREDLRKIVTNEIRKSLDGNEINLVQELNNFQKITSLYNITIQQYCDFCDKLSLAMMAKLDNVDYMECIRTLQRAKITPANTYDEHIRLHNYQRKLLDTAIQLEQSSKSKSRN